MIIRFQNQNIRVYFAENLKYLLKKNHLSYKQFIELLEYDQSQLYKVGQWTNSFVLPNDKIKVDYDEDYIDEKLRDMYKNLHYTYAEITLNYGNRIHYNLV